jgi:hypothetical protein
MTYELAEKFLEQADEFIESKDQPEKVLEALEQAEKCAIEEASVLCRSARVLFRYGVLHSKGRFLLLALDKIKQADEKNPLFFQTHPIWLQLWGNILLQIGKFLSDSSFFEMAEKKYSQAAQLIKKVDLELYWDWGDAWALIGVKSGEASDLEQALSKFYQAQSTSEGTSPIFFRLDYGNAFFNYSQLTGNLLPMEESIALFRSVIADSYFPEEPPSIAYVVGWRRLALALKSRFLLSHRKEHLEEADRIFKEAILSHEKNGELWLDWGDLFLQAGWLKREEWP